MQVLKEKRIYLKNVEYVDLEEHDRHLPFMEQEGWIEKYYELCDQKIVSHYEKEIELMK